jgi:hypothetical protein
LFGGDGAPIRSERIPDERKTKLLAGFRPALHKNDALRSEPRINPLCQSPSDLILLSIGGERRPLSLNHPSLPTVKHE